MKIVNILFQKYPFNFKNSPSHPSIFQKKFKNTLTIIDIF